MAYRRGVSRAWLRTRSRSFKRGDGSAIPAAPRALDGKPAPSLPSPRFHHSRLHRLPAIFALMENGANCGSQHMSEALRIFKATVGDTSPLTAHALAALGKRRAPVIRTLGNGQSCLSCASRPQVRASQGPQGAKEALKLLRNALTLEVAKDAFHLETVWDLLNTLKDLQMSEVKAKQEKAEREGGGGREGTSGARLATLQALYGQYLPLVHAARSRLTEAHERDDVGTLAVFFKTAGEVCLLAQEYDEGKASAARHDARAHARAGEGGREGEGEGEKEEGRMRDPRSTRS
eukprot:5281146-Pleurochrysis_carterae.AAC.1